MKDHYVVHLTPATGLQASARIARFIAGQLGVPLLDSEAAIRLHLPLGLTPTKRDLTLWFVNGPIAFSGIRDILGTHVLPRTKRVNWCQNDYSIGLPPNKAYSRPTNATTPFRKEFHSVPEVALYTTCWDFMGKFTRLPGGVHYINWNALTYAPMRIAPIAAPQPRVLYYGALREDRKSAIAKLLDSPHVDVSVSRKTVDVCAQWRALALSAVLLQAATTGPTPATKNSNHYGVQPLLGTISGYAHSIYMADTKSNTGAHSLANRFYEVLSTPATVLWLDKAGAQCYVKYGLKDWERYAVGTAADWDRIVHLPPAQCALLAKQQRKLWLRTDPYAHLCAELKEMAK